MQCEEYVLLVKGRRWKFESHEDGKTCKSRQNEGEDVAPTLEGLVGCRYDCIGQHF